MGTALDQLLALRDDADRFDLDSNELRSWQLEAVNERLETRIDQIPLLKNRADAGGVTKISQIADLVPVLFAHNTYKTYAESWLRDGQWDRMARWLATVSTYDPGADRFADVGGFDDWVARLEPGGRFMASSSGTTGKPAILDTTEVDLEFASWANVSSFAWATGIEPANDRKFLGLGPRTDIARNERVRMALTDAFGSADHEPYLLPVPPITTGSVMEMILLRRRIADGTATPADVTAFEGLTTARTAGLEAAMADAVEVLVASKDQTLFLSGMFQSLYPLAIAVRERGLGRRDFQPENSLFTGGGLKGTELPPDYREVIKDTFNVTEQHAYQLYSMQEVNSAFPRCGSGRYHVPPWIIALPLDRTGDVLLDPAGEEIEARAAFFDLSLDARWGGVITGDRVTIDAGSCACGHGGPTIGPDITRYADLEGGDKITCAGTIDAYVRGAS